ncbi:MAG TPA: hypothetical protein VKX35_02935, partial [Fermentimonas sp.]|nr:hypothetical protein [Fermentimonas sp.]
SLSLMYPSSWALIEVNPMQISNIVNTIFLILFNFVSGCIFSQMGYNVTHMPSGGLRAIQLSNRGEV